MKQCDLRTARERAGIRTQTELAERSGVNLSTISRIESGEIQDPANSTVERLELALKLRRGTLVFGQVTEARS